MNIFKSKLSYNDFLKKFEEIETEYNGYINNATENTISFIICNILLEYNSYFKPNLKLEHVYAQQDILELFLYKILNNTLKIKLCQVLDDSKSLFSNIELTDQVESVAQEIINIIYLSSKKYQNLFDNYIQLETTMKKSMRPIFEEIQKLIKIYISTYIKRQQDLKKLFDTTKETKKYD